MDDLNYGKRNKRGNWAPNEPIQPAPLFSALKMPRAFLKWLPHYFLPWNFLFLASAALFLFFLTPERETLKTLEWGWILSILLRNSVAVAMFYGAFELHLYVRRAQANRFKYNGKFPADSRNPAFILGRQNIDNLIRGFGTGVPIWTGFEVIALWASANGYGPWLSFAENPWYLIGLWLVLPLIHEVHFFAIHRLIHIPILYKLIHSVHHNSVNPSPYSSLSMHPVEHLLYFATAAYHFIIPSHPFLVVYQLHFAGFGAVVGHIGFDKIEVTDEAVIGTHAYAHYLHHKYFEVNYADGLVPLDKWFGSWHDGTAQGDAAMRARFQKRKARINAGDQ